MTGLIFVFILLLVLVWLALQVRGHLRAFGEDAAGQMTAMMQHYGGALLDERVQQHLPHDKPRAIAAYRHLTGAGAAEAQAIIEACLRHPDGLKALPGLKKGPARPAVSDAGLRDLLAQNRFDDAVKAYQAFAGTDIFSAREAVAALQQRMQAEADDAPDPLNAAVARLVARGDTGAAIALYRQTHDVDAAEARQAVAALERFLQQ
ncbi:MAG: hypothetical protein MUE40_06150 [Anaerolineae bacterium]|nr:hypothetical protein [Anaerolineae bacterium]